MTQPHNTPLNGPQLAAASGNPKQLVIILHGWGADGDNLIDLARAWQPSLPDAHFCAPHAPHACEANPFGYQWFSLADRSPHVMQQGAEDAATYVNAFIDAKINELFNRSQGSESADEQATSARSTASDENQQTLTEASYKVALVGFSQGTMTALHVGLRRDDIACVLGYSGALLETDDSMSSASRRNLPICLIHGEADDIVPFAAMGAAEATLRAAGHPITTHGRPGLPHSIDMEGLEIGGTFLVDALN